MKCARLNALECVDLEDNVGKCANPMQFLKQSIFLLGVGGGIKKFSSKTTILFLSRD